MVGVFGACIGASVDMIAACDVVYAAKNAFFSIKEIDLGVTTDLGTLNRLPIMTSNWSLLKELALTGQQFGPSEARDIGLISRTFETQEEMEKALFKLADFIAQKSPLAIIGVKKVLNHVRSKQVEQGLEFVGLWNMSQIFTGDIKESVTAMLTKRKPNFQKL